MAILKVGDKDLPKDLRNRLKKRRKEEVQKARKEGWIGGPFSETFELEKCASDKKDDVMVRLLVVRKHTGRWGGVDFRGAAIDVKYDIDDDLLTVKVHNTGTRGNHPNDITHGKLQVPNLLRGDPDRTVVHYPVSDCGKKSYKKWSKREGKTPKEIEAEEDGQD